MKLRNFPLSGAAGVNGKEFTHLFTRCKAKYKTSVIMTSECSSMLVYYAGIIFQMAKNSNTLTARLSHPAGLTTMPSSSL